MSEHDENKSRQITTSGVVTILVMLVLSGVILAGTIVLVTDEEDTVEVNIQPPLPTATNLPTATPGPVTVYVVGAVERPETTVELPFGSRASDAIEAAGGPLGNANLQAVNMAERLVDGQTIMMPTIPVAVTEGANDSSSEDASSTTVNDFPTPTPNITATPEPVNINTATLEELQTLPGIGEVKAQAIIDYREENGPFEDLDALVNVSGFGERTVENLRPYITVGP